MHFLCYDHEIKNGGCKGFEINSKRFFAVKKNQKIFLYANRCPHAGLPLNWQEDKFLDFDGELIQCSSHGALFRIESGKCVAGPCAGKSLSVVPFEQENGRLSISDGVLNSFIR